MRWLLLTLPRVSSGDRRQRYGTAGQCSAEAQSLLEDYVTNVGNVVGKEYTIQWNYLEEGSKTESVVSSEAESSLAESSSAE